MPLCHTGTNAVYSRHKKSSTTRKWVSFSDKEVAVPTSVSSGMSLLRRGDTEAAEALQKLTENSVHMLAQVTDDRREASKGEAKGDNS